MNLREPRKKKTVREQLIDLYEAWHREGRKTPVNSRLLAGLYAVLYRRKYKMLPISPVQDDVEHFDGLLTILSDDRTLAPYCIEALFAIPEFNQKAAAFANANVLDKWNVIERAHKLRSSNGPGEQAEFRSANRKYGVVRV